jgi:site-specific DNA-methyltransferase (cytosine-N4-specific)
MKKSQKLETYLDTLNGKIVCGDSRDYMKKIESRSVNLIVTSPPYGLTTKKEYGNEVEDAYLNWFESFVTDFKRVLKPNGSLVIDLGGAWKPGNPTRSLYQFKLLILLCEKYGFHLAQEFFWWNPSKLPSPAQWVTVDRVRVKDSINYIWWLSPSKKPKADNRQVLVPYSDKMQSLLKSSVSKQTRPSGHEITDNFLKDNGAAIPPNLLAIANTCSNDPYSKACRKKNLKIHPA